MPRELGPGRRDAATLRPLEREPRFWGRPAPRRGRSERGFRGPPPQHIFGRRPRRRHRPRATAGARRAARATHVRPLPLETLQELAELQLQFAATALARAQDRTHGLSGADVTFQQI